MAVGEAAVAVVKMVAVMMRVDMMLVARAVEGEVADADERDVLRGLLVYIMVQPLVLVRRFL